MGRNGADDNYIGRQMFQLGNIALSKGNLGNYGMGVYDRDSKGYKIADSATQEKYALAKAKNIDVQEKMKRLHWNAIFEEDKKGNVGQYSQHRISTFGRNETGRNNSTQQSAS